MPSKGYKKGNAKTEVLQIRLTSDEKEFIQYAAGEALETMAEYILRAVKDRFEKEEKTRQQIERFSTLH